LGKDKEGWRLATEVHDADGYNVVAYNLITLRDELDKFETIENDRFIIRMDARESRIYGDQVAELLLEAHDFLCEKYGVTLDGKVTVEIFPQQKDFAIRTFGVPGGAGFLGVCFGPLITANSPASQGERPANWRSVLWHEFCHVVTLQQTANKIPRWLSEGISVYEEQEKDASWGERLTPAYRAMILGDELTPVSQLSGAFLQPKSPIHLQFAYYESSLAVRYILETHGIETIQRVLTDLSVGMPINTSLERYVGSTKQLDADFDAYARNLVASLAPDVEWESSPEVATFDLASAKTWLDEHPNHYQALKRFATLAMQAEQFGEAEKSLLHLRAIYPEDRSVDGTLALLASLYRQTGRPEQEMEVLAELTRLNDRAVNAYIRLAELQIDKEDWAGVRVNAKRLLAVNPLLPSGHELLAKSAERLDKHDEVATALTALLEMSPIDPAGVHYRIASAHQRSGSFDRSKRHVLMALEQAPRYRDAQRLLLQLVEEN
jgi:tetratricopeptide (TPR) repeat protein